MPCGSEGRRNRLPACWLALGLRPDYALVLLGDGSHAFVEELLDTLAAIRLGREDVAFRVRRDAVHRVELARLASAVSERGQNLERIPLENVHLHVRAVGHVEVFLLRVLR